MGLALGVLVLEDSRRGQGGTARKRCRGKQNELDPPVALRGTNASKFYHFRRHVGLMYGPEFRVG